MQLTPVILHLCKIRAGEYLDYCNKAQFSVLFKFLQLSSCLDGAFIYSNLIHKFFYHHAWKFFFVGTALVIVVSKPHNTEIAAKIGLISFALKTPVS